MAMSISGVYVNSEIIFFPFLLPPELCIALFLLIYVLLFSIGFCLGVVEILAIICGIEFLYSNLGLGLALIIGILSLPTAPSCISWITDYGAQKDSSSPPTLDSDYSKESSGIARHGSNVEVFDIFFDFFRFRIGRSDEEERKWKDFFERLMKEVIQKLEDLQKKFLEAIEKHELERLVEENGPNGIGETESGRVCPQHNTA
ncbi:trihelix transcription factor GT-2-like protein [Corchorus capsularis]|uniref:Trihelix transcription factor GT-2-like protein n=1 Tax=Corchorus capsularis TaxID=210143 RepID=A0A1R3G3R6_COCAP|nr:trihelix transcription factor GT-2-like protein [Corchorus capsularis]